MKAAETQRSSTGLALEWQTLLARIGSGDAHALTELYRASSPLLLGVIRSMVGDHDAAEEALLDVYEQVWRTAGRFDPERGSATAFLCLLARSRALDRLRLLRRTRSREVDVDAAFALPSSEPGPKENAALGEVQDKVRGAVRRLPVEQRELIELAWFKGLSHREIVERVRQPLGTVKTRIRSAMLTLRHSLQPLLAEHSPPAENRAS